MSRRMCDHQLWFRQKSSLLWRYPAGPKHRHNASRNALHSVADKRRFQVCADLSRVANMNRRPVIERIPTRQLSGYDGLARGHPSHRHHQFAPKPARGNSWQIRIQYPDLLRLWHARPFQRVVKRKARTYQKSYTVIPPQCTNVAQIPTSNSVSKNGIARQVRSQVGARCTQSRLGHPAICYLNQRARLRVSLTVEKKVVCLRLLQNNQIALNETGNLECRSTSPFPPAHGQPGPLCLIHMSTLCAELTKLDLGTRPTCSANSVGRSPQSASNRLPENLQPHKIETVHWAMTQSDKCQSSVRPSHVKRSK